jgi:phenylalanyl-tRNA synthetase alpha chain
LDKVASVNPEALQSEALAAVAAAATLTELDDARVRYLGRSSELKLALREVRDRETGMTLNAVRVALETAVDARQSELERAELDRTIREDRVDVTMPGRRRERGHLHLVTQVRREVEDIFLRMGYEVVDGREVETSHYLFDALNMAPNHVTRSPVHSFYVGEETLLRTETSPSQIHTMEAQPPPVYVVSLGRCYRRDTPDATHYPIFHQVEGLCVDTNITFGDLKGTLDFAMKAFFGSSVKTRFFPSFFPFTEPSADVQISCPFCGGSGCRKCKHSGWIELLGCGMVDPAVFGFVQGKQPGYDAKKISGFAFGMGIDRIAMMKYGIGDIGLLYSGDLRFLEQFG